MFQGEISPIWSCHVQYLVSFFLCASKMVSMWARVESIEKEKKKRKEKEKKCQIVAIIKILHVFSPLYLFI
jgi:hypothetical protein